jgi:hypothetical protein
MEEYKQELVRRLTAERRYVSRVFFSCFRRLKLNTHNHNCDTCKIVTNIRMLEMTVFNTDVTSVHTAEYCDFVKWVSIHPAVELKTSFKCSITASNKIMGNWTFPVLTLPTCCVRGVGYRFWWCVSMCSGALLVGPSICSQSKPLACASHAINGGVMRGRSLLLL